MGFFSKLRGASAKGNDGIARHVLTPAVSTMVADGDVDEAELAQLSNVCAFSPIYFSYDGPGIAKLVKEVIEDIKANGHDAVIAKAAAGLSPALRETSLCFAMRLALADGKIEDGEKASLAQTAGHMEIPVDRFSQMFEVIAIMQRPPEA